MNYSIYYLSDNTEKIRYIGLTCKKLSHRLRVHLNDERHNFHKINWVKKNKENIKIVLIEDNLSLEEAKLAEIQYIYNLKKLGSNLLNATDGGDCSPNKGKVAKNKGIIKYDKNIVRQIQNDYIPYKFGSIKLSKKYNIPTTTIERYLKIELKEIDSK